MSNAEAIRQALTDLQALPLSTDAAANAPHSDEFARLVAQITSAAFDDLPITAAATILGLLDRMVPEDGYDEVAPPGVGPYQHEAIMESWALLYDFAGQLPGLSEALIPLCRQHAGEARYWGLQMLANDLSMVLYRAQFAGDVQVLLRLVAQDIAPPFDWPVVDEFGAGRKR